MSKHDDLLKDLAGKTSKYIMGVDAYDAEKIGKGSLFVMDEVGHYETNKEYTFLDQISYKQIFSGGVNDYSLELAVIKAKRKVKSGI